MDGNHDAQRGGSGRQHLCCPPKGDQWLEGGGAEWEGTCEHMCISVCVCMCVCACVSKSEGEGEREGEGEGEREGGYGCGCVCDIAYFLSWSRVCVLITQHLLFLLCLQSASDSAAGG